MRSRSTFTALKLACFVAGAVLASGLADAAKPKLVPAPQVTERAGTPPTRWILVVTENGQRIRTFKWVCVGCEPTQGPGHPSDGMGAQNGTASTSSADQTSLQPN